MQTKGISLIMAAGDAAKPVKGTKISDSTFDSFMDSRASKVAGAHIGKKDAVVKDAVVSDSSECSRDNKPSSGRKPEPYRLDAATGRAAGGTESPMPAADQEKTMDVVAMSELIAQTMVVLQEVFGLSEEEMADLLSQMGIQVGELLFQQLDGVIVPVDTNAIQDLVLGVHGIDDRAALLINDGLTQEIAQLTEEITDVIAEAFGVEPEEVEGLQQDLMFDFAEQLQQAADEGPEEQTVVMPQDVPVADSGDMGNIPVAIDSETHPDGAQDESSAGFEESAAPGTADIFSQPETEQAHAVMTFTENLSEALERSSQAEDLPQDLVMMRIVEQVVRQVRIRVMPETTSLELQLHPANLGRVSLTVATTAAGVATATMAVENQMAKNALESQMISLKETFAEQGLKVEEVEVTVAEFGMNQENQQQEAAGGKRQRRRFQPDHEPDGEETGREETLLTASERRDANSVVDYTA